MKFFMLFFILLLSIGACSTDQDIEEETNYTDLIISGIADYLESNQTDVLEEENTSLKPDNITLYQDFLYQYAEQQEKIQEYYHNYNTTFDQAARIYFALPNDEITDEKTIRFEEKVNHSLDLIRVVLAHTNTTILFLNEHYTELEAKDASLSYKKDYLENDLLSFLEKELDYLHLLEIIHVTEESPKIKTIAELLRDAK